MNLSLKPAFRAGVAALALIATPVHACLNDRDTLTSEAQKHPDVLQAITGRFERNPPLYYEMRIARVEKDLQAHPGNLDEYDDIAVAFDRLGRDGEAIEWLGKKRAHLAPLAGADAALTEEWYRYYANIGTCRVDRWIRAGSDWKKRVEVQTAYEEITRAVKIKPSAHFGREKYQLVVMEWLLDSTAPGKKHDDIEPFWSYAGEHLNTTQYPEAATAFAGLITLGNAWESVDVFYALAYVTSMGDQSPMHVGYLAMLRGDELAASGHQSLVPEAKADYDFPNNWPLDQKAFTQLRREADRWSAARSDYMLTRLHAGRHPDTDPTFWAEYRPAAPPAVPDTTPLEEKRRQQFKAIWGWIVAGVLSMIFGLPIVLIGRVIAESRRRKRTS